MIYLWPHGFFFCTIEFLCDTINFFWVWIQQEIVWRLVRWQWNRITIRFWVARFNCGFEWKRPRGNEVVFTIRRLNVWSKLWKFSRNPKNTSLSILVWKKPRIPSFLNAWFNHSLIPWIPVQPTVSTSSNPNDHNRKSVHASKRIFPEPCPWAKQGIYQDFNHKITANINKQIQP